MEWVVAQRRSVLVLLFCSCVDSKNSIKNTKNPHAKKWANILSFGGLNRINNFDFSLQIWSRLCCKKHIERMEFICSFYISYLGPLYLTLEFGVNKKEEEKRMAKISMLSANFCLLGERKETLFIGQNTNVSSEFAVFVAF